MLVGWDWDAEITFFLLAAGLGNFGIMKVMYESKPDVLQQTDKYDYSALHFAARHGCLAAVNQVLEWDPKLIDGRTDAGYTPFMKAAAFGHVNVMMALYAKREDKQALLTGTDKMGSTALHSAALHDHSAAVSQLLEWGGGALLDIKSRLGGTPWDLAKHNRKIRDIMQKYMDVFEAVKANDVQSVHRLIDVQGKDILDSQDDEFPWKRTPFIAAVQYVWRHCPALCSQGGQSCCRQSAAGCGWTPFILAAAYGNVDVMQLLFAKGGGTKLLTKQDNTGDTALHRAALNDHSAAVSQL
ncbi:unnamed protein product [Vitrella brassicaformis CCMP3155]|uniref:Uncharacterized protein n=1 Tax=Vitrella brassicaformis (strain CCMP3155) TaxID=1169540 RepID=A0A0G4G7L9_VITBC|nr:unnamed protein product [Vitrella brassicaformis CCMP3155]|eukprot:CEM24636.1 unnamed protein product [Vitrella brassicaformis CCMP3155]